MKNRFNNISSKEWLPYQKSWFMPKDDEEFYLKTIRFFVKYDDPDYAPNILFKGSQEKTKSMQAVADKNKAVLYTPENCNEAENFQYIFVDLRDEIFSEPTLENYKQLKSRLIELLKHNIPKLKHRRFASVVLPNIYTKEKYFPFAWDLSYTLSESLTLKDEKIACINSVAGSPFENDVYYMLNFRNDENAKHEYRMPETGLFDNIDTQNSKSGAKYFPKRHEIIKPPRRNKKEVLHPAKYPEELIGRFIETFTREEENVFDPMSGTGSTQLAALQKGRNGYGTELSSFFAEIASDRLQNYLTPEQKTLDFEKKPKKSGRFKILNKDARKVSKQDFPPIDYIITSPPYWDMLNMKGAENQAARKKKGLQLNYSESDKDFGNIADYDRFINELSEIYFNLVKILKPGGVMTIIVKNIKKKGRNYPFAYDLGRILQKELILLPEFFWLQDDINLAPYGYGNTFVSNTFHQYCLNFMKPS